MINNSPTDDHPSNIKVQVPIKHQNPEINRSKITKSNQLWNLTNSFLHPHIPKIQSTFLNQHNLPEPRKALSDHTQPKQQSNLDIYTTHHPIWISHLPKTQNFTCISSSSTSHKSTRILYVYWSWMVDNHKKLTSTILLWMKKYKQGFTFDLTKIWLPHHDQLLKVICQRAMNVNQAPESKCQSSLAGRKCNLLSISNVCGMLTLLSPRFSLCWPKGHNHINLLSIIVS